MRFKRSTGSRPGHARGEEARLRTIHSFAATMWCAMRDGASGLSRDRIHATRRRWRSWRSWRCPATPNAERGHRRGASVRRLADTPEAVDATAPHSGAAADSRLPSGWCPGNRRPWPRSRCADLHRRWDGPPQASRANGRRNGRRTTARCHARAAPAPVRRSAVALQVSPTPRAAVRGRVRRRTATGAEIREQSLQGSAIWDGWRRRWLHSLSRSLTPDTPASKPIKAQDTSLQRSATVGGSGC